ncbi:MAG TPA: molybdopterin-binding protein [Kofleriaceae bacterium]|nr:molybdopterin-binding protein [Kofleriaceae bacterium]
MDVTAGIVIIGDEILSGKFAEENAAFLLARLRALGVRVKRVAIIPDDVEDIGVTVAAAAARFDHVFTSGGVGPTHDDVTMAGIARGMKTQVTIHPVLEEILTSHMGDRMTEAHLRLAQVPEGAILVHGKDGAWPVVCFRNIYILPGVPSILRRKFSSIESRFLTAPFWIGRVFVGADETAVAAHLDSVAHAHPEVGIGSYPRLDDPEVVVIVTVEGKDPDKVQAAFSALGQRLGEAIVRSEPPAAVTPP